MPVNWDEKCLNQARRPISLRCPISLAPKPKSHYLFHMRDNLEQKCIVFESI